MKTIVHFRVVIDYEKTVFRDIQIGADASFLDLHEMIQEAFGFDNTQMASFYMSNDNWDKGLEITLMSMLEPDETDKTNPPILEMALTSIGDLVKESGQKLVYVSDFMLMWCFYIEALKVYQTDECLILPRITQSFGTPPGQYDKAEQPLFDVSDPIDTNADEDEFDSIFKDLEDENNFE
ncbi:MAG: hypothetical protein Kow0075_16300 [Salibacteraceae bacterium]